MEAKDKSELKKILENPETRVFKYTQSGLEQKSREVILEWLQEFPHLVKGWSKKSGRFLTATSLYKIV